MWEFMLFPTPRLWISGMPRLSLWIFDRSTGVSAFQYEFPYFAGVAVYFFLERRDPQVTWRGRDSQHGVHQVVHYTRNDEFLFAQVPETNNTSHGLHMHCTANLYAMISDEKVLRPPMKHGTMRWRTPTLLLSSMIEFLIHLRRACEGVWGRGAVMGFLPCIMANPERNTVGAAVCCWCQWGTLSAGTGMPATLWSEQCSA